MFYKQNHITTKYQLSWSITVKSIIGRENLQNLHLLICPSMGHTYLKNVLVYYTSIQDLPRHGGLFIISHWKLDFSVRYWINFSTILLLNKGIFELMTNKI